ncbi:MAG: efflux RND transporter periplasmic adaptor subunit [Bacteroidales bacterium]|jgi:RND family efflux transporter MFP subunit|nr:efflux RND transporter periplasmic adaptor subunit [Bacteroidales bacterium]
MKENKRTILYLAIGAVILCSCGRKNEKAETIVYTAKIDTIHSSTGIAQSVYPGTVKSDAEVSLSFRVAGTIDRILFEEGKFVRKGTVIAEIDARDYRIQLSATEAEYNQIKLMADRVVELYKRGSATKSDYEKAVYGLQQITAKYNAHKNQLKDTRLEAPFDGYIHKKIHDAGETVAAGMSVISMIGGKEWQIEINLSVQDYARKKDFNSFEATVSTNPDKRFPLELFEISPKGNATQLYKMVFIAKNPNDITLAAGMSAEVTINFRSATKEVVYEIPVSATFEIDGQPHVWIFTSEEVPLQSQPVVVDKMKRDGYIIITQGIKEGDMIVTSGVHSIKEGMKIKPLPSPSKTNIGGLL